MGQYGRRFGVLDVDIMLVDIIIRVILDLGGFYCGNENIKNHFSKVSLRSSLISLSFSESWALRDCTSAKTSTNSTLFSSSCFS